LSVGPDAARGRALASAVDARTSQIVKALDRLDDRALGSPSQLRGWSRLTIACHLRYGAAALLRMTQNAIAGTPVPYYPDGRDRQRPQTLHPRPGESGAEVVASLARSTDELMAI
jgi:hypothetical protein